MAVDNPWQLSPVGNTYFALCSLLRIRQRFNLNRLKSASLLNKRHSLTFLRWAGVSATYHEEGAEVHASQQVVLHLGDLEEDSEKLALLLQTGEKQRGGSLPEAESAGR